MAKTLAFALMGFVALASAAQAQDTPVSQCQAIAQNVPGVVFASATPADLIPIQVSAEDVKITYLGHSTFSIETPAGTVVATDFNGWYRPARLPDVVTMNKAHSTHYTLAPDPGIQYVLHGWSDVPGEKADHDVVVGDTYVRNVTTDIRSWDSGGMEHDGNSIFIFEVAGLCIGHLGHLHHELTDAHYAEIGRLDILMVPVDGGLTMGADSMSRIVKRLHSSLILPMHRPGQLDMFLAMFDEKFDVARAESDTITVSMRSLPKRPLIYIPRNF
ncbi:MBL fold metallo-hydrolase [Rhizobium sp. LjRoot30]|uniref:MBL fold metallo-hydrolase n=1 Tax=Rhizobium sp. LjRoot30 TaxID=3342320 RepID=UPI003ECDACC9